MSQFQVTQVLNQIDGQGALASETLLPMVYQELRQLAIQRLRQEKNAQTLQATALVHEAYLRLVDVEHQQKWDSRRHFFAAAAEAMRRILIENARRKNTVKRGKGEVPQSLPDDICVDETRVDLIALNEALDQLALEDKEAAQLVKLRYFSGLTIAQSAEILDISSRSAERLWTFAKAWLYRALT